MTKLRWPTNWVGSPFRVLMIVGIAVSTTGTYRAADHLDAPAAVIITVVTAALLLHPRKPDAAIGVVAVALTVAAFLPDLRGSVQVSVPVFYATYLVSAYSHARLRPVWLVWLLAGTGLVVGGDVAFMQTGTAAQHPGLIVAVLVAGVWLVLGFFWMVGLQIRRRRSDYRALQEKAELAGVVERTRIAREMHDIVAHSLSGVIALADGARFAAAKDPQVAVDTLATISDTSRQALKQMRGLLSVLREDTGRDLQAAPGAAELGALIDDARRSGLDVRVTGLAEIPAELPTLNQFTLYRIIQEMLTNMLRHASEPMGTIGVTVKGKNLTVRASNPAVEPPGDTAGFGLVGMRERGRAHGGRLRQELRAGRFTVTAEVPA
ncbi:sensor histidine kinase [Corynebacterium halotolerans]|uniref:histidine kinase n=1 Tax=Corynebacterium halotolerans YIM 70093 = DSM 44683 TaxID=1121362 RepID=M1NTD8_9CORY|nr:histidine kinase [Corynebacterium halotolerans]AGF72742.1 two-component system sensor histidine kinase [Corynebacterium halotolerans YIM 70093 = DSM 44683]